MRRCTRCVLTEKHAHIKFTKEGLCNYCLEFEQSKQHSQLFQDREEELVKILEEHKGQGDYDCLVMLSGGKDSTYALYLLKERYRLNVLGFTFDNGFEPKAALENVRRAVDTLGVDHLYFKPAHMKRLFRFLLQNRMSPFVVCPLCKSVMNTSAWKIAKKFGVSLIILGNTTGQGRPKPLHPNTFDFFAKAVALVARQKELRPYLPIYLNRDLIGSNETTKDGVRLLSPYQYVKWEPDQAIEILKDKLAWKPPTIDYPRGATNCLMNLVNVYISRAEYGFSFYDTELSTLVRHGEMTRKEALWALDVEIAPETVNAILTRMNLSLADLSLIPEAA